LVAVLSNANSSPDVRSEALKTLLRIPNLSDNTLTLARGLLRDSSVDVRCGALSVLGKHVTETSTAEIRALLQDANALVRRAALEALKNLPPSAWESAARSALRDPDHEVVFFALCRLKDAGLLVKGDVVPLSYSSDPKIRSDATWASVAIKDEDSPLPEELLHDPDPRVRRYAILGQEGAEGRRRVPKLIGMLQQESRCDLIDCLIRVLGKLNDRRAVPALIEMTKHPDGLVRQNAARALGRLGDGRAIPALKALLTDHVKPSRRNEQGSGGMSTKWSVADAATEALSGFSWWQYLRQQFR
jgi:HEAT repeat protein